MANKETTEKIEEVEEIVFNPDPLVAARAIRKITLKELAEIVDVAPMTLMRALRGQDSRVSVVKKVASSLGVRVADLFVEVDHAAQRSTESLTGKAET